MEDIFCALSGLPPEENEIIGESDTPYGWIKITIEKKHLNPEWASNSHPWFKSYGYFSEQMEISCFYFKKNKKHLFVNP